jgi:precorrin-6B methylase 2
MPHPQDSSHSPLQFKKTNIINRLAIFFIRETSNYFWIIIDILSSQNEKIEKIYEHSIGEEYINECKAFPVSKGKKILHVGCGSYPLTEMTLVRLFEVNVVGIDKNKKAVQRANKVITKKNLTKKITIMQGNGADFPLDTFDVIIVSSCALPKKDILTHIFKTAKKNCSIIIRDLEGVTEEILHNISKYDNITIEKKINHPVPYILPIGWNAFYLKKH